MRRYVGSWEERELRTKVSYRGLNGERGKMKRKTVIVGAAFVALLAMTGLQSMVGNVAAYELSEAVVYPEGIGLDGTYVTPAAGVSYVETAANVQIDWSDDLIFHQFPAGQKVRTEVILHDLTLMAAVYSLSAHFRIEQWNAYQPGTTGSAYVKTLYSSSIIEGLWVDGPSSAYTAEVNENGLLLYGYNWDTRKLPGATWYRLVFWIDADEGAVCPLDGAPIVYRGVDITSHAPGDYDTSAGAMYGFVGDDYGNQVFWLDMYLLSKTTGRK
jgi:hypothetical protein